MPRFDDNWVIADIGATNSRCALLRGGEITGVSTYRNDEQAGVPDLLREYLGTIDAPPRACAIAVAAPVDGDEVTMINRDWRFDRPTIASLGFERVDIINDFHAIAYALPTCGDASRVEVGRATHYRDGNIAVLGPGSGLGMSAWVGGAAAMCGEGGHITMAGRNEQEDRIIARLRERFGHLSAERVLSGPGLLALHEAMHGEAPASAEAVTAATDDRKCRATLAQFFLFLGSVAAELALITGASGGLYIAGGIVPANIGALQSSGFRDRFEDKNRYRDYMRAIPTWVMTDPYPGLTGLAARIAQGLPRP